MVNEYYILDESDNPKPVDSVLEWANWFEKNSNKRKVAYDKLEVDDIYVEVSTVFLGSDHSFGRGEPLIYETMIFGGELDDSQWRYSTKEQALEGHKNAVKLANSKE